VVCFSLCHFFFFFCRTLPRLTLCFLLHLHLLLSSFVPLPWSFLFFSKTK
jgi:hypothetical protein